MNRKHKSRPGVLAMLHTALWVCAAGAAPLAAAQSGDQEDAYFRGGPESGRHALIITGAAASDEIRERFSQWSNSLHDVLARDDVFPARATVDALILTGGTAIIEEHGDGVGAVAIVPGQHIVQGIGPLREPLADLV